MILRVVAVVITSLLVSTREVSHAHEPNLMPYEARLALEDPASMTLLSLDPIVSPHEGFDRVRESLLHRHFYEYRVLGQTKIGDRATQKKIVGSVEQAVRDFDGVVDACFDPRHGLRVVWHGHTYDFLICYQCHNMQIYTETGANRWCALTGSSKTLDDILRAAHIPLAKK